MNNETFPIYLQGLKDYSNQAPYKFFTNPAHQKAYDMGRFTRQG